MQHPELPRDTYLRRRQLLERLPFGSATLDREIKAKRFPAPIHLSPRTTVWRWGDVLDHLAAQGEGRDLGTGERGAGQ